MSIRSWLASKLLSNHSSFCIHTAIYCMRHRKQLLCLSSVLPITPFPTSRPLITMMVKMDVFHAPRSVVRLKSSDNFPPVTEPRWASVNRGVLICDECCSIHRGLGRHSSQVRHLTHSPWPPSQLQVRTCTFESNPSCNLTLGLEAIRFLLLYFFSSSLLDGPDSLWQRR